MKEIKDSVQETLGDVASLFVAEINSRDTDNGIKFAESVRLAAESEKHGMHVPYYGCHN